MAKKIAAKSKVDPSIKRSRDFRILGNPVITEKAGVGAGGNLLILKVARTADRTEIREAVERVFNVKVKGVNTVNVLGKPKRVGTKQGRRASFKKAYITLEEGYKLDIIEGL